jgi:hypothetical protein
MLQLLQTFTGELQLFVWCLLSFLDEGVKNNHTLTQQEAIEGTTNAGLSTRTQLKQREREIALLNMIKQTQLAFLRA